MAISLDNIPTTIRVPLAYVEFNNENAVSGTAANPYRLLVLGQKTSAGTHPKLSPVLVTSADQAAKLFGVGSMLHAMLAAVKKANGYVETWALAAEDNESGQKAAATVTLSGSTTKSGTLWLYVGGVSVSCKVVAGEELSAVATRLASAVNADGPPSSTCLPASAARPRRFSNALPRSRALKSKLRNTGRSSPGFHGAGTPCPDRKTCGFAGR